jgi:hypothetical protein
LEAAQTLLMTGFMFLGLVMGRATAATRAATSSPAARNPQDGLGRGEPMFLAKRQSVQVRGCEHRNHASFCLFFLEFHQRLFEDLGA